MMSQREAFVNGICTRISAVQAAITQVEKLQKGLEHDSNEAKETISNSMGHLSQALRNREVQLKRQVDVYTGRQRTMLQKHQARLHQNLGSLQSSLSCAHNIPENSFTSIKLDNVDNMTLPLGSKQTLNMQLNEASLLSIIQTFGEVTAPGRMVVDESSEDTWWPRTEDYDDEQQHLLYKTVQDVQEDKENAVTVQVLFPKLPTNTEDWLRLPTTRGIDKAAADDPLQKSVHEWLRSVRGDSESGDESDLLEKEFEMVSPDFPRTRASTTEDSIEIIMTPPSCCSSVGYSAASKITKGCEACSCCGDTGTAMDIETISTCPTFIPTDTDKWLFKPNDVKSASRVASVCRANQPCRSFMECVCEVNCAAVALKEIKQSKRDKKTNENINVFDILQPIQQMSSQSSDWLASSHPEKITADSKCMSQWLLSSCSDEAKWVKSQPEKGKINSIEKSDFLAKKLFPENLIKWNPNNWVKSGLITSKSQQFVSREDIMKKDEVGSVNGNANWLVKNLSSDGHSNVSDVKNVLRQFLKPADLNVWLKSKANDRKLSNEFNMDFRIKH